MQNEVDGLIGVANGHSKGTMFLFETQDQSKMAMTSLEERGIACRGYIMQVELDDEYGTADMLKIVE